MCGIFGATGRNISRYTSSPGLYTDVLRHRGPDDSGAYIGERVFLGHRRLSIIDLEGGKQPIFNEDRSCCIVFNGEIYNYKELQEILAGKGHRFGTNSDTEVILHAYEEYGAECVQQFRGMFAFAIWDENKRSLFVARDRLGIKPVFYTEVDGTFFFSSEIKALQKVSGLSWEIDRDALYSYISLSYIPAPLTIYRAIRKLLPGHYMIVNGDGTHERKYWDLFFGRDQEHGERRVVDELRSRLDEAVRLRMVSDVPVGAFLSGGVDSGTVVALMNKHTTEPVRTFCIGFGGTKGGYLDERELARTVAERYGTQHLEFEVTPQIVPILGDLVDCFDEPFADSGAVPTDYLCGITSKYVKVALSGLGGDELFGGYERYLGFRLSSAFNRLPAWFRQRLAPAIVERLTEQRDGHYTINHIKRFVRNAGLPEKERYLSFVRIQGKQGEDALFQDPDTAFRGRGNLESLMYAYYDAPNAMDPLDKVFYLDMKTYLPDDILALTDRISMRHSLEVRVPLLDHLLVEYCARIPNKLKVGWFEKKRIFRKAVRNLLPREIFTHRKQGFIGPMAVWLQTDLKDFASGVLDAGVLKKQGIFRAETVRAVLEAHWSRKENFEKLIWTLIMFQVWYHRHVEPIFADDVTMIAVRPAI